MSKPLKTSMQVHRPEDQPLNDLLHEVMGDVQPLLVAKLAELLEDLLQRLPRPDTKTEEFLPFPEFKERYNMGDTLFWELQQTGAIQVVAPDQGKKARYVDHQAWLNHLRQIGQKKAALANKPIRTKQQSDRLKKAISKPAHRS